MTNSSENDPVWQAALDWVLCAQRQPLDAATAASLSTWLAQDPAHGQAYEKASRVWLLTGLIPPSQNESE
jgi:ferric-dicitrate binding protein FerR (iron transport regulator)